MRVFYKFMFAFAALVSSVGMMPIAAQSTSIQEEPITDQPVGKVTENMVKHSLAWGQDAFGSPTANRAEFAATKMVEAEDGSVYLYNPFGTNPTSTYLKGYKAEGNTVVFPGPQPIADISMWGFKFDDGYAVKMKLKEDGSTFVIDSLDTDIHMVFVGDTLKWAEPEDGTVILGFVGSEGDWQTCGDFNYEIYPQNDVANVAPEDVDFEPYLLKSASGVKMVNVAVKNQEIFVKGFGTINEEMVWKGNLKGTQAVFADGQYLGVEPTINYHVYAFNTDSTSVLNAETGEMDETLKFANADLTFDFDAEAKTLTLADHGLILNVGKFRPYYISYYKHPELGYFTETAIKPAAPVISSGSDLDEDWGYGHVVFGIAAAGENGEYLMPEKVRYLVYVDGEKITTTDTETGSEYFFGDESDVEDDIYSLVNYYNGYREFQFFDYITTVGFQTVYLGADEETYSDIVTYNVKTGEKEVEAVTGISAIAKPSVVGKTQIFDLSGRQLSTPTKGINIIRTAEGKTLKVLKK